jgi:hypothetical protein
MDNIILIVTFAPLLLRIGWAVWGRLRLRRSSS